MNSPFLSRPNTVQTVMLKVLAALLPGVALSVHFYGVAVLVQLALATAAALAGEAAMLRLRGVPLRPFLSDGSAVLTAWLLALALPPLAPWWLTVVAALFAIVVGKQLYGGLGNNPFNPAMLGFALAIVSFPAQMNAWPGPDAALPAAAQLSWIFTRTLPDGLALDALTSATPLDHLKTQLLLGQSAGAAAHASDAGLWLAMAFAAGGLWLWRQKLIPWQTPLAMLAGVCALALPLWWLDPGRYASPLFHLGSGATLMAAAFIVTDPVSCPTTPIGRLIFGFLVGVLVYVIRVFGGYPDAVAFAVLIMNIATPFIDQATQPRVFGRGGSR